MSNKKTDKKQKLTPAQVEEARIQKEAEVVKFFNSIQSDLKNDIAALEDTLTGLVQEAAKLQETPEGVYITQFNEKVNSMPKQRMIHKMFLEGVLCLINFKFKYGEQFDMLSIFTLSNRYYGNSLAHIRDCCFTTIVNGLTMSEYDKCLIEIYKYTKMIDSIENAFVDTFNKTLRMKPIKSDSGIKFKLNNNAGDFVPKVIQDIPDYENASLCTFQNAFRKAVLFAEKAQNNTIIKIEDCAIGRMLYDLAETPAFAIQAFQIINNVAYDLSMQQSDDYLPYATVTQIMESYFNDISKLNQQYATSNIELTLSVQISEMPWSSIHEIPRIRKVTLNLTTKAKVPQV